MDDHQVDLQNRRSFLRGMIAVWAYVTAEWPATLLAQRTAAQVREGRAGRTRMDAGSPSATAQGAAMLRAAHQLLDEPVVFDDPLALRIIGAEAEAALRADPEAFDTSRSLRASVALRSRYAEDQLADAVRRGVRQYVVLGAGLDTFAYRNPYRDLDLRDFEVDHPATQVWKRQRLAEAAIEIPNTLVFAPVDFERETLAEGLRKAGFRPNEPAYFSWLGVVIYLTRPAVMATLEFVAGLAPGSEIVFSYSVPALMLSEAQRSARAMRAVRMLEIGEPWITYFDPADLAGELRGMGYAHIEDVGSEESNARYFKNRDDGLRLGGGGRLMKAGV